MWASKIWEIKTEDNPTQRSDQNLRLDARNQGAANDWWPNRIGRHKETVRNGGRGGGFPLPTLTTNNIAMC